MLPAGAVAWVGQQVDPLCCHLASREQFLPQHRSESDLRMADLKSCWGLQFLESLSSSSEVTGTAKTTLYIQHDLPVELVSPRW